MKRALELLEADPLLGLDERMHDGRDRIAAAGK